MISTSLATKVISPNAAPSSPREMKFSDLRGRSITRLHSPMELLYTRRIGRKLPDGSEVPLIAGSKVFGRLNSFEYGAFFALTDTKEYYEDDELKKRRDGLLFLFPAEEKYLR
jgi:hypothetical protein